MALDTPEHLSTGFHEWEISLNYYLPATCFLAILLILTLRWLSTPKLPTINAYPGDLTRRKARTGFTSNARKMLFEGLQRYHGPFRIITTLRSRVILPASWATWVKSCPDLDHSALVCEEYFADYPECQIMHDHIAEILEELWTDAEEWHGVNVCDFIRMVARVSSAIFVGPDLARNPEWQNLIITYTISFFNGARALRAWSAPLRPFVHWFLPECKIAREQVRLARRLFQDVLVQRAATKRAAEADDGRKIEFHDSIQWIEDAAKGCAFDPAAAQLGLAMGALHTTTELLK